MQYILDKGKHFLLTSKPLLDIPIIAGLYWSLWLGFYIY